MSDTHQRPPSGGHDLRALRREVADVLTLLVAGSNMLDERWDRLTDERRRELTSALARRSKQLQETLGPLLSAVADQPPPPSNGGEPGRH